MKKLSFFLSFLFLFLSCSKDPITREKTRITDSDLKLFLSSDPDFSNFVKEKKQSFAETKNIVANLSNEDRKQLKIIYNNYQLVEVFVKEATPKEKEFFESIFKFSSNPIIFLENTFKKLDNYIYSTESFYEILFNNLSGNASKNPIDCNAVWWTIYIQQLNWNLAQGLTLDDADMWAKMAADWAYVGCVMGQQ